MNYLLDRKSKKKNPSTYIILIVVAILIIYFRSPIFSGLSYISSKVFRPFLVVGGTIGDKFSNLGGFFSSKNTLIKENEDLRNKLAEQTAQVSNYDAVLADNTRLQEIFNRKPENLPLTLSAILAKPNGSLYDTLIIDIGTSSGVKVGNTVFASGDVPVGYIAETSVSTSKVILFSNPGERTDVVISGGNVFTQIVGRGGGNFEMEMPRDFDLQNGVAVTLPGITPRVVATVETIISDPRDSFQKALLVAPVNIFELKFVEVEVR